MNVHLAFGGTNLLEFIDTRKLFGLYSYHYVKKNKALLSTIHNWKEFILDSGIFTYLNGLDSKNVDWNDYVDKYAEFVRENNIRNYVEVDVDTLIGLEGVERLRERLENRVGWKCIPVWHMNRGYDKWLEICRDYSYVCFGAFITDGLKPSKYMAIKKFLYDAKKENCKVHGLGMTSMSWLRELKFHSVDSSTWTSGNRYGEVHIFEKDIIKKYRKPRDLKFKNGQLVAKNNLIEWTKFVEYAENNL
jgi:hypothetical protein